MFQSEAMLFAISDQFPERFTFVGFTGGLGYFEEPQDFSVMLLSVSL